MAGMSWVNPSNNSRRVVLPIRTPNQGRSICLGGSQMDKVLILGDEDRPPALGFGPDRSVPGLQEAMIEHMRRLMAPRR
jgi:hypothetical protein